jgi:hypothetical protein
MILFKLFFVRFQASQPQSNVLSGPAIYISPFLHFSAYLYCHFLFALRFSRSSSCLASLNLFVFSSEGHLRQFLKALFLFPIRSIRRFSDSENQSGLFLVSLSASLVAVSTTYSSNLLSKSFVERRFMSSGLRSSRKLLILFLKFSNSLFLRMVLSIFFLEGLYWRFVLFLKF